MQIKKFSSNERGTTEIGWLQSYHSFSFGGYYNPENIHFGVLRVINDDTVAPGQGFGKHPHDNMEIITIPIRGSLKHGDSMGNTTVISAGEIQMMSAGTGVVHSEYNNSTEESVEFLQIWVIPNKRNTEPRYQQISYTDKQKNMLHQLIGPDTESPIQMYQDAHIHLGTFDQEMQTKLDRVSENKLMYIFVIDGALSLDGVHYARRDAAMITDTAESINIDVAAGTTLLVFELPEL